MGKKKVVYLCQECGYDSPKWLGKCPGCGNWNTMVEEIIHADPEKKPKGLGGSLLPGGQKPVPIGTVEMEDSPRFSGGSEELDRVLGGGIIPGSVVLIVGDPGIGKSSLTLQACAHVAVKRGKVLYVTGEESARQIRMRAERLGTLTERLYVVSETDLDIIHQHVLDLAPDLLIIDSIQTMFKPEIPSAPGSVSQVREGAAQLLHLAKTNGIATFIVGHVTKDGSLAGPRVLEHIVDTVLYLEGDRNGQFRILRAVKNRFGSTNEIGIFEMREKGMVDVPDASLLFLSQRPNNVSGSVVVSALEGTRPMLVEVQALVSNSAFVPPRRTSDGIDIKQVQLLLAVLEKRVGLHMGNADVYVKVAGGITVDEPAIDLGLAVVMASSFRDWMVDEKTVVFGEVGLAGEVRAVAQPEQRIREAEKMGFRQAILPKGNLKNLNIETSMNLIGVENVEQALGLALQK